MIKGKLIDPHNYAIVHNKLRIFFSSSELFGSSDNILSLIDQWEVSIDAITQSVVGILPAFICYTDRIN